MNNHFSLTLLAIASALSLSGCNSADTGSGSSGSSTKYYSVSFVELADVSYSSSTTSSCKVYGYIYDDTDTTTVTEPDYKVIGYPARPNSGFSIVIHNADGSIEDSYTSSDWGSSATSYKFKQSLVPDDGYVSFVRKSTVGGDSFDITTIAKSLLPTSMAVYSSGTATSTCISGSTVKTTSETSYITNASASSQYFYGFNTYAQDISDLTNYYSEYGTDSSGITFNAPSGKSVMAVRYSNDSDGDEIGELEGYKILTLSQLEKYTFSDPVELDDVEVSGLTWTAPTDTTSISAANMYIYHKGTGALLWQPLSTSDTTSTYAYTSDIDDSNYRININGVYDDWTFEYTQKMSDPGTEEDSSTALSDLSMPTATEPAIDSCSTSEIGSCLSISSDSTDFDNMVQRIEISLSSGNNRVVQTIYSDYNALQPIMEFDDSSVDDIWSTSNMSAAEVSVVQSTDDDIFTAFLYGNQSVQAVVENTTNSEDYADNLPLLTSYDNAQSYIDLRLYQPHVWFEATYDY